MLLDTANRLAAQGHRIVAVIACEPAPDYGGTVADFQRLAERHGAPYYFANSLNAAAVIQLLLAARPDIGVSAGWPQKIGARAVDIHPFGILNIHGGDLPRYRGNAPFAWAILNGEREVGITVHLMDDGLDSGPIVVKQLVPLNDSVYIGDLYAALDREGPELFVRAVAGIADGSLTPCPQTGPTLTGYSRRPEDGMIHWADTADAIARLVRASAEPLAGAFCTFGDQRLRVWRARVEPVAAATTYPKPTRLAVPGQVIGFRDDAVLIHCGGWEPLVIETVQLPDGDRQPAASVVRSLRDRLHNG